MSQSLPARFVGGWDDRRGSRGMYSRMLKSWLKRIIHSAGLEVRRVSCGSETQTTRDSLSHVLEQARSVGFQPKAVIDIGAAHGTFTRQCIGVFPTARYLLVEPLREYQPILMELSKQYPSVACRFVAATHRAGEMSLHVHPDLVGSSLYLETERDTDVNGTPRVVDAMTLDELVGEAGLNGPFLLKVDVQGAELDVLRGAERTLRVSEYVLLEVSFFEFFHGGPQCSDVIEFMKERGFVPYDIVGLQYRPLDRALSQADIAFVQEDSLFRQHHHYATPQQRAAQNRQIKQHLEELFARKK